MSASYCAMLLGSRFQTFRKNVPSSSSELRVRELTQTSRWRRYVFRNVGKNYVTTWHNNPKDLVHNNYVVESSSYCFRTVKNIFVIRLCSSLIVSRYMTKWNDKFFMILGCQSPWMQNQDKGKCEYCSVLIVATKNSKIMAVFTAGSWSRNPNSARRKKEYTFVLWNSFMFIVLKHCHVSKLGFDGMVFVTKVVHDLSSSK